jgi:hypothetical protein
MVSAIPPIPTFTARLGTMLTSISLSFSSALLAIALRMETSVHYNQSLYNYHNIEVINRKITRWAALFTTPFIPD